ncbi:flagellar export protein FliJ [Dyella sp. M7H15-1]|uniref:flagellar export protein FliJ n=1 Tax=Dyella sp. M7H15-1 TaxID=2501295 RepID=UPI001004FAEC|nr:flagellar export protein FliJ [Dyella sp. M7H15-1]QAU24298.1 flagellar export protein FliJ [Dyella sp. M7H15-1]
MNTERTVNSLSRLVELRERDVDRLTSELASQQAVRVRYVNNLERMEHLLATAAASDMGCPVLSSNSAHYKASLIDLISHHRRDLACHDADIEVSRQALITAALKHRSLGHVLQNKRHALHQQQHTREQKQQDQLATQAWSRARLHAHGIHYPANGSTS